MCKMFNLNNNDEIFDFVRAIQKEEKIITNEDMIERVRKIYQFACIELNDWSEDYVKFLLSLNEMQLTAYEKHLDHSFDTFNLYLE